MNELRAMRRAMVVLVMLALLSVPAAGVAHAGDARPRLIGRDCGVVPPIGVSVSCQWLIVPERRDSRSTKTIKLAVATLQSRAAKPEPDPVVFLEGGPGGSAVATLSNFATSPMLENRDIIVFDQRGAGKSEPSLNCPEREEAVLLDLTRAEPHSVELAAMREAIKACKDRLESEGVDLEGYDTEESASDVADLRKALELDEWNLYGVSYGTRLALATMRSHPEGIRSVVLDSVYPTDDGGLDYLTTGADAAFERLFDACAADVDCAEQYPDIEEQFASVVADLNAAPAEITLSSLGLDLLVTGDDVLAGLFDGLYDTNLIPTLPTLIDSVASGDVGSLEVAGEQGIHLLNDGSEGMFISMECADAARFAGRARDERIAESPGDKSSLVRFAAQPYCDDWGVEPLPDSFSRPVRSKIPALVFAGSLDPITPASDSKRASKTLTNSTYVELAGWGHAVTKGTDCPRAIRQAFLDDPAAELDVSCADAPPPAFLSQGLI